MIIDMNNPPKGPAGAASKQRVSEIRSDYAFGFGVRGKYDKRAAKGTNVVLMNPDVVRVFRIGASVNRPLRTLLAARPASKMPTR
jgi:hypothetical protein